MNVALRKKVLTILILAFSGVSLLFPTGTVQAANKKLKVQKVYDTSKKVTGTATKKGLVKIKLGKKIYKSKVSKKGKFSVKIPKQKVGKLFYVRLYQKKRGKWKFSKKKKIYVLTKGLVVKRFSKNSNTIQGYSRPNVSIGITFIPEWYEKNNENGYMDFSIASLETDSRGRFVFKRHEKIGNNIVEISAYQKSKEFRSLKLKPYDF